MTREELTQEDLLEIQRKAEAHVVTMREALNREKNWDAQERQWVWQRWFWISAVILAGLGIIFK